MIKDKTKRIKHKESVVCLITTFMKNVGLSSDLESKRVTWWAEIATVIFLVAWFLQTVALVTAEDNGRLFECLSVFTFSSMGLVKLFSLRVHRQRWLQLLDQMRTLEYKHVGSEQIPEDEYESDDDEALDLTTFINEYTIQFASISKLLSLVYRSPLIIFIISPFVEYIYQKYSGEFPDYPHVLSCWTPLDQMHIVGYMVTIIVELVTSFYCVALHVSFDQISAGVMIFLKGQFFLLRRYMENIAGKGKKCNITKRRDQRAFCRIKYSHETLMILFSILQDFDKLLRNIMGLYYCQVTLSLGTIAMRLKMEVLSTSELLFLVQYLGATLIQLFFFCYYGDAVSEESSMTLGQGPSGSAHWCISARVRRQLALLAIGVTLPRRLRAGPFHFLDLPSFTMIVRAAYSYYAILGE